MPRHCTLRDPLSNFGAAKPFGVNDDGAPVFECLRLLTGTVDIYHKSTLQTLRSRHCFLTQSSRRLGRGTLKSIVSRVFDQDLTIEDAAAYLTKGGSDNKKFWSELNAEICLCLDARSKKRNVEAFLYLYRMLEMVSLALPLVYASSQPDYKKALDFLKALSSNPRDGDLAIFKQFSRSIATEGGYTALTFDFFVRHQNASWRAEAQSQIESHILSELSAAACFSDNGEKFSIPFAEMSSFYVTFRNKLFHNSQSGSNFRLDPLFGASSLCGIVIDQTLYWFTLVVVEIVKAHARRYI